MVLPSDNASLASLTFLTQFFREEAFNIQHVWSAFGRIMGDANAQVRFREDSWEQDWFLAKYAAEVPGIGLAAYYQPPSDFYAFPTFDIDSCVERFVGIPGLTVKRSHAKTQISPLFSAETPNSSIAPSALQEFYDLRTRIRAHGDPAMAQLNHILAWLNLALGHLFTGIALTPVNNSNVSELVQACEQRWSLVWQEKDLYEEHMNMPEIIQWKLDVFYGAELAKIGLTMHPSRQGQPQQWREHWGWVSSEVDAKSALAAVQIAARLMAPLPIYLFLQHQFRTADRSVTTGHLLATILFRRWILQLRAMSWLETALQRSWQHIRPRDLAAFAFGAVRPHWPRSLFGLSHRSMDIKDALSGMRAWSNFRYSIDATFVPNWETNVATVWGLFSAAPGLIRVPSEHYEDSVWCLRERELFDYLRDEDDFLDGRYLIELPQTQLRALDTPIPDDTGDDNAKGLFRLGRFPRITTVFTLFPFEPWENKLLACAAAVRLIFLRLQDPELTRIACLNLANGFSPPPEFVPLTNHPNGWSSVMGLFADFQKQWEDARDRFPLAIVQEDYSPSEIDRDMQGLSTITDLSDGVFDDIDVLAAFEWNRTILPALVADNRYGSFFSVDYRYLTEDVWARDAAFMVIRGVNKIRSSVPLWFLQNQGQQVDEWKGMGTNPIFTAYVPGQWNWMMELMQEPEWPANFHNDSKLRFSEKLSMACAATKERGNAYYQGKIR